MDRQTLLEALALVGLAVLVVVLLALIFAIKYRMCLGAGFTEDQCVYQVSCLGG